MKKVVLVLCLLCAVVMVFNVSCATIFDGTSGTRGKDIQWGYFVLDILFCFPLSTIIDFADGAIYARVDKSRSEIEQQLKDVAMRGKPAYIVRDDGCYKVEVVEGTLKERKIAHDEIPDKVWNTIEKEKASLMNAKPK